MGPREGGRSESSRCEWYNLRVEPTAYGGGSRANPLAPSAARRARLLLRDSMSYTERERMRQRSNHTVFGITRDVCRMIAGERQRHHGVAISRRPSTVAAHTS